ncbi:MFS transporter [Actinophytocola sp.]|uniref:MFS transporter n=1 Tax=Actinophytocola sp. TaxID=1872138 RepID=UPI0025BAC2A0|nr:MFS transporter [Actinophytocola sp.]
MRRPRAQSLAYPVLLILSAVDSAGYSVIAPTLPTLAERHHAGPAVIGALASTFPLTMMVGFAAAGRLVRAGRTRTTLLTAIALAAAGAMLFATAPGLPALFAARALMGLGSGGLWIGVTFATLAYWPGQEYLCMSRIYAAYSAGALLGPMLGALGGTAAPFLTYALLLAIVAPAAAALPKPAADQFHPDRAALRTRGFWVSAIGIMLAILATGALDGVLPLHFADRLSQTGIGLTYLGVGALIAIGSAAAGHQPPARMLIAGAAAITTGLTLTGATTTYAPWAAGLLLIGLGAGAAQTGATGLLLAAVPTNRIVTAMVVWSQLGILGYLAGPALGGLLAQHLGYAALGLLPAATLALLALVAGSTKVSSAARTPHPPPAPPPRRQPPGHR